MASPFDNVTIGSIVVTKPPLGAERATQAIGRASTPMAIVGMFSDDQQRRWGVAVPLFTGTDETSVRIDSPSNTAGQLSSSMVPNPKEYSFVPLHAGTNVPYQTRMGKDGPTAEMGRLRDPFAHSDLRAQATLAYQQGVEPKLVGVRVPQPQASAAAPAPRAAQAAAPITIPARTLERAERYGAAQAAAILDAIPSPSKVQMQKVAVAYGVPQESTRARQAQVY